jgi:hypothetical protein
MILFNHGVLFCVFKKPFPSLARLMHINMLHILLFSYCVYSSITTEYSWTSKLDPQSPDYLSQLYCGTAGRGLPRTSHENALDSEGFKKGLAAIIRLYKQTHQPILNEIEIKWLTNTFSEISKQGGIKQAIKGIGNYLKTYKALIFMKRTKTTINSTGISLASLLTDAKEKHRILNFKEKEQFIEFVKSKSDFNDYPCGFLLYSLLDSIENRSFIIPDYASEKEIEAAITEGISSFSETMENREITVLGYYAYAQISRFKISGSTDSMRRVKVALKLLGRHLSHSLFTGRRKKEELAGQRIIMGIILNELHLLDDYTSTEILKFTDDEKLKIQAAITSAILKFGSKKFQVLEVIAADLLGLAHPAMQSTYRTVVSNSYWLILCPDVNLAVQRLKRLKMCQ